MDLSKAFHCISHDLIIAKIAAYDFDPKSLEYILSYLANRKQSTRLNEIYSAFQKIMSGVTYGSILGPIIFNILINDFFLSFVNRKNNKHADDNTLSSFSNSIYHLIKTLESETNIATSWLRSNKMIANPDKFHSITLTKHKAENLDLEVKIGDKTIQSERYVKLFGVTIDNKLNFEKHVSGLCRSASPQLNALFRFSNILPFKAKFVLVQSFVYSNFN